MRKHNPSTTTAGVEELFLLQALRRLRTTEQRYIFTQMADLISHGMVAQDRSAAKNG
jgi:hypothetical protein